MKEIYEQKMSFLEQMTDLLQEREVIKARSLPLIALQDSKPSGILYQLGEGVRKQDFGAVTYSNELPILLNSLAKIFAFSFPYSVVGMEPGQSNAYVALASDAIIDFAAIKLVTIQLINSDLDSNDCIPIVAEFYRVLETNNNEYVKKILDLARLKYTKTKNDQDLYQYAAYNVKIFYKYFSEQDIVNIKQLNIGQLRFEQIISPPEDQHNHVELNLVVGMRKVNTSVKQISIGLASSNIGDVPGSCGYCAAALDAFSQTNGIEVLRSHDFQQNIPKGHWNFPHELLDTIESNFIFFQNICLNYQKIVEKGLGSRETFELLEQRITSFEPNFARLKIITQELIDVRAAIEKLDQKQTILEAEIQQIECIDKQIDQIKQIGLEKARTLQDNKLKNQEITNCLSNVTLENQRKIQALKKVQQESDKIEQETIAQQQMISEARSNLKIVIQEVERLNLKIIQVEKDLTSRQAVKAMEQSNLESLLEGNKLIIQKLKRLEAFKLEATVKHQQESQVLDTISQEIVQIVKNIEDQRIVQTGKQSSLTKLLEKIESLTQEVEKYTQELTKKENIKLQKLEELQEISEDIKRMEENIINQQRLKAKQQLDSNKLPEEIESVFQETYDKGEGLATTAVVNDPIFQEDVDLSSILGIDNSQ